MQKSSFIYFIAMECLILSTMKPRFCRTKHLRHLPERSQSIPTSRTSSPICPYRRHAQQPFRRIITCAHHCPELELSLVRYATPTDPISPTDPRHIPSDWPSHVDPVTLPFQARLSIAVSRPATSAPGPATSTLRTFDSQRSPPLDRTSASLTPPPSPPSPHSTPSRTLYARGLRTPRTPF